MEIFRIWAPIKLKILTILTFSKWDNVANVFTSKLYSHWPRELPSLWLLLFTLQSWSHFPVFSVRHKGLPNYSNPTLQLYQLVWVKFEKKIIESKSIESDRIKETKFSLLKHFYGYCLQYLYWALNGHLWNYGQRIDT